MLKRGELQPRLPFSLLCFSHRLPFSPSNIKSPLISVPSLSLRLTPSVLILSIFAQLKMQPVTALHLRLDQAPPLASQRSDRVPLLYRWFYLSLELNWQICISTIVAAGIGKKDLGRSKIKNHLLWQCVWLQLKQTHSGLKFEAAVTIWSLAIIVRNGCSIYSPGNIFERITANYIMKNKVWQNYVANHSRFVANMVVLSGWGKSCTLKHFHQMSVWSSKSL